MLPWLQLRAEDLELLHVHEDDVGEAPLLDDAPALEVVDPGRHRRCLLYRLLEGEEVAVPDVLDEEHGVGAEGVDSGDAVWRAPRLVLRVEDACVEADHALRVGVVLEVGRPRPHCACGSAGVGVLGDDVEVGVPGVGAPLLGYLGDGLPVYAWDLALQDRDVLSPPGRGVRVVCDPDEPLALPYGVLHLLPEVLHLQPLAELLEAPELPEPGRVEGGEVGHR